MGLGFIYFVVLSPTGLQVTVEPYDPVYVTQSLLPSLVDFWHQRVIPAFQERDRMPTPLAVGQLPSGARGVKRPADVPDPSAAPTHG